MTTLCDFSLWFSTLVAHELEEARILDHQSRETSWTDRMLLELKRLRDPRVIAVTSNEKVTGGDMDWWFVRGGFGFCLTVQAKILHYRQHNSALWHYEDIAHPAANPGLQSRTLTSHARRETGAGRPRYPYYIFYNPGGALPPPHPWFHKSLHGVTAMDGYAVANYIARNLSPGHGLPISAKRYTALQPMMMPLHQLLCRPFADIPGPDEMIDVIERAWADLREGDSFPGRVNRRRPASVEGLPREIRRLIDLEGRADGLDDGAGLARDTVVFLSE